RRQLVPDRLRPARAPARARRALARRRRRARSARRCPRHAGRTARRAPGAAGRILEKILARGPGSVAALTRLSKIYERAGDWDRCKAALEQALALSPTGRDAADLFFRLGEVARIGDSDADTAIQYLQQALKH